MKKLYFIFILFFVMLTLGRAQDPHFSQFYNANSLLNPSLIGVFDGKYRVSANYRTQWGSVLAANPFTTYMANGELKYTLPNGDFYGLNVRALYDNVGKLHYTQTSIQLGGSYLKKLSSNRRGTSAHYLGGGVQAGIGQNGLDWGRVWFGRQFDIANQVIDFGADDGEDLPIGTSTKTPMYLDVNVGLMWYSVLDENCSVYFGAAGHHLNQPNIGLLGGQSLGSQLYRKWTIHSGAEIGIHKSISFLPAAVLWLQGPSVQGNIGTSLRFFNFDTQDMAFRIGMYGRMAKSVNGYMVDALIGVVGFEQQKWKLGLSYDLTLNDLSLYNNNRGAFELSFFYINVDTQQHRSNKIICPSF